MFKKLLKKIMSNEEIKDDVTSEENTRGAADPQSSAPAEPLEASVETPTPKDQVPGVEVPEGHQVPGTDMSPDAAPQSDPDDPAADEVTNNETVSTDEIKANPTPVEPAQ